MEERDVIKDVLKDGAHRESTLFTTVIILSCVALLLISILALVVIHCQNTIKETTINYNNSLTEMAKNYNDKLAQIFEETDFYAEYEITTDNQSFNMGNLTVNK